MAARLTRRLRAAVAPFAAAALVLGCQATPSGPIVTFPPASIGPGVVTGASDATVRAVEAALGPIGLFAVAPDAPYRPGESARFSRAPRTVLLVTLPDGAGEGYISIYEFADGQAAASAGREQADYVASPVGRVQFATGTRFVLVRSGPTVVFYPWHPDDDPAFGKIAEALRPLGEEIAVPG